MPKKPRKDEEEPVEIISEPKTKSKSKKKDEEELIISESKTKSGSKNSSRTAKTKKKESKISVEHFDSEEDESPKKKSKNTKSNKKFKKAPVKSKISSDPLKGKIFYARVAKGFPPKVTFDAMATNLSRIIIRLTKKGIFSRVCDRDNVKKSHAMWDVNWPRKRFSPYRCVKDLNIGLNVKHLQKLLRNVKKKDALIFFITKKNPTQLGITIQPTSHKSSGPLRKAKTVHLSIQIIDDENVVIPLLPDTYVNEEDGEVYEIYGNPVVVESSDFQEIKKMTSVCKTTITVKMQKNNYLSFEVGDVNIMATELEFGELTMHPEDDDDEFETDDDSDVSAEYSVDDESEESESKEKISDDEDVNSDEYSVDEESSESEDESMYPGIYKKEFNMPLFTPLVKLASSCTQLEIYSPKMEFFPLKISLTASSGLGDVSVYIRDREQIAMIEKLKERK
jgi:hypothetical protein